MQETSGHMSCPDESRLFETGSVHRCPNIWETMLIPAVFLIGARGLTTLLGPVGHAMDKVLPSAAGGPDQITACISALAAVVVLYLYLFGVRGFAADCFGITNKSTFSNILRGVLWSLVAFAVGLTLTYLLVAGMTFVLLAIGWNSAEITGFIKRSIVHETKSISIADGVFGVVLAVGVAPFLEEFLFRGLLFRGMRRMAPFAVAAVLSSALFTALHFYIFGAPSIFVLGMFSAWIMEKQDSLTPCIAMHFAWNLRVLLTIAFGFGGVVL